MMDTNIDDQVQRIQGILYAKANREPETRFNRLYKYFTKTEWVEMAIDRVLRNCGSRTAGIDGKTRRHYQEAPQRTGLTATILEELRTQTYHPQPVRRIYIEKANGKLRPLGIPTIKDRVIQQLMRMVLEPIYEATFLPCSYGFRPNRCTWDALAEAHRYLMPNCQYYTIIEGDIQNCFGNLHHGLLMRQLQRRISDKQVLTLVWEMLRAGVIEDLRYAETRIGAPQGGIVSPLLANIYMHRLDEWFHYRFHNLTGTQRYQQRRKGILAAVRYIRYADDFIVLLRRRDCAAALKEELAEFIAQELQMQLSEEKTTIVQANEGFDFLGVRLFIAPRRSNPQQILPFCIPAKKSIQAYRDKVKTLTRKDLDYLSPEERIIALNRLVTGWANYHHWGNARRTFESLSYWTVQKVYKMLQRYTGGGKRHVYAKHFRPISECANLQKWKCYTQWLTPSVTTSQGARIGLLPMAAISAGQYWRFRGSKIPPAYGIRDDDKQWRERETEFFTDAEVIESAQSGQAVRWYTEKYGALYLHNRNLVLKRDKYTCTVCGYQSQRQRGEVHDLEVHHIVPGGGDELDNLRTVCLPCHRRLTASQQAN